MRLQNAIWKIDKLTERDIPALVNIFKSDPSIREGLELTKKQRANLEAYFEDILEQAAEGYVLCFVARLKECGTIIGGVMFLQYTTENTAAWERCFWLRKELRRQGYATQITSAATEWLLSNRPVEHIREMTRSFNHASIRLKRKQGFALDELKPGGSAVLRVDVLLPSEFRPQHI